MFGLSLSWNGFYHRYDGRTRTSPAPVAADIPGGALGHFEFIDQPLPRLSFLPVPAHHLHLVVCQHRVLMVFTAPTAFCNFLHVRSFCCFLLLVSFYLRANGGFPKSDIGPDIEKGLDVLL
jgi:hypothetical protein